MLQDMQGPAVAAEAEMKSAEPYTQAPNEGQADQNQMSSPPAPPPPPPPPQYQQPYGTYGATQSDQYAPGDNYGSANAAGADIGSPDAIPPAPGWGSTGHRTAAGTVVGLSTGVPTVSGGRGVQSPRGVVITRFIKEGSL